MLSPCKELEATWWVALLIIEDTATVNTFRLLLFWSLVNSCGWQKCEFQRRGHSKHRILTRTVERRQKNKAFFCFVLLWGFLVQNVVRWLTARAKWLENTLMLFRGCEDTVPFTGLISWCLLVRRWQNSPRVHGRVTSLQKRKWGECVKTNFQGRERVGGGEKKHL